MSLNKYFDARQPDWNVWMPFTGTSTPEAAIAKVTEWTGGCDPHIHYCYGSVLDGLNRPDKVAEKVKRLGGSTLFVTDHGKMMAVPQVALAAKKHGLSYVIGCEFYVKPHGLDRFDRTQRGEHLVVYAKNNAGYVDLCKLCEAGERDGQYWGRPIIDEDILFETARKGNLIASSACLAGALPKAILSGGIEAGRKVVSRYKSVFGTDYYIELQNHHQKEDYPVLEASMRLAREMGVRLIATNDSHYTDREDAKVHDVMLCINTNRTVDDPDRWRFSGDEYWMKTPEEMMAAFNFCPEALRNTAELRAKCRAELDFSGTPHLPEFEVPSSFAGTDVEYFDHLVEAGMHQRYGRSIPAEHLERCRMEVDVIKSMGFVGYFLIVADFIGWAKSQGIAVGPGRGSGAGSIVAYALQITDIDPIRYNLLFERFLNPERISMPDFDIDFEDSRRAEVIEYVTRKYGANRVSQILTFQNMLAKQAVIDVARAYGLPHAKSSELSACIPQGFTIQESLDLGKELFEKYQSDRQIREIVDVAQKLEGVPRSVGKHACGMLIADRTITDRAPISMSDGQPVVQYTKEILEEAGLIKMDFLGLRNLSVIKNTVAAVNRRTGGNLDISQVDEDDCLEIYDMLVAGDTTGVFQFESPGMVSTVSSMFKDIERAHRPGMTETEKRTLAHEFFERLVAATALYRPGPMDYIPQYVEGINNPKSIHYDCPELEGILKETYGVIVYQEQVQQICRQLAGYSYGRADLIRRAMGKKKIAVMNAEHEVFIHGNRDTYQSKNEAYVPGCVANGISAAVAEQIWHKMEEFAKYAFNRSHAVAYTRLSVETAWLKFHYPLEFAAELITSVQENNQKIRHNCNLVQKKLHLEIKRPDVNRSFVGFARENDYLRFGLCCIKYVGKNIAEQIVAERDRSGDYTSLYDFTSRLYQRGLRTPALKGLIQAGAFDAIDSNRAELLKAAETVMKSVKAECGKENYDQVCLFDLIPNGRSFIAPAIEETEPMSVQDLLRFEREVASLYLSGSPFKSYQKALECVSRAGSMSCMEIEDNAENKRLKDRQSILVAGVLFDTEVKITKKKTQYMCGKLQDDDGEISFRVPQKTMQSYAQAIQNDEIVALKGILDVRDDGSVQMVVFKVITLVPDDTLRDEQLRKLKTELGLAVSERGSRTKTTRQAKPTVKPATSGFPKGIYLRMEHRSQLDDFARALGDVRGTLPVYVCCVEDSKRYHDPKWTAAAADPAALKLFRRLSGENGVIVCQ